MRMVLASASPRRKELLAGAGYRFTVCPSREEETITMTSPSGIVEELSHQKALSVLEETGNEDVLVIGADTIVCYRGEILGKPASGEEAQRMLTELSGETHQVYTGVTILCRQGGRVRERVFHECTDVTFEKVSQETIREYILTGEPMDKAGSYGIQGKWGIHVTELDGDYDNVVGLPVKRLQEELRRMGFSADEADGFMEEGR